jgi:hypothetical protein
MNGLQWRLVAASIGLIRAEWDEMTSLDKWSGAVNLGSSQHAKMGIPHT